MPPNGSNLIQELLAKSVKKFQEQLMENLEDAATLAEQDRLLMKTKLMIADDDTKPQYKMISLKEPTENLTKAVVYNHLNEVAPVLAKEFKTEHSFKRTELRLKEVVRTAVKLKYNNRHVFAPSPKNKNYQLPGGKRSITPDEDDQIKAAIEEAGETKVNITALAKQLNRDYGSVKHRIELLKKTGGRKKVSRSFTLVEDYTLLETLIIPRISNEKLSEILLLEFHCTNLAAQLDKTTNGIRYRWHCSIQPWLLQHYSGTLNLRIERRMANFLAKTFKNVLEINWSMVLVMEEFAGHTETSMKQLLFNLQKGARKKLNLEKSELSLQYVADYCEQVYGEGAQGRAKRALAVKMKRQKDIIDFFERKIKELGIVDFL